jgi:hypothetical protein
VAGLAPTAKDFCRG